MNKTEVQTVKHELQSVQKQAHALALTLQNLAPPAPDGQPQQPSPSIIYLVETSQNLKKNIAFLDQLAEEDHELHKKPHR